MKRIALSAVAASLLALPGCIIVDGSSDYNYEGYGAVSRPQLDTIIAANTQNRIGEAQADVLARYPAENISLMQSSVNTRGEEVAVYRVYARTKSNSTRFERYLVFENGRLALLTDDRDDITPVAPKN